MPFQQISCFIYLNLQIILVTFIFRFGIFPMAFFKSKYTYCIVITKFLIYLVVQQPTQMDTKIGIVTEQEEKGVYVAQFKVYDLAIFTYYVESNKECYLIDPTFDYIIFKQFINKRGSTLKYVLLTHYHADFLSAHCHFNVSIIMGEKSKRQINSFQVTEMKDNSKFKIGNVETRVLATPGHTTQSACFVLANQDNKQFCIFTGDTVFLKEVGRPDLAVSSDISSADLAGMLFDSVKKIKALDKNLRIYPGHGSGSACGKSIGAGNFCTLAIQHQSNYGFLINDKKQFIQKLTAGLQSPPSYFFYDAKSNQQGIKQTYEHKIAKCKKPIQMEELKKLIEKKVTVVDTRLDIKSGIIEGSYWMSAKGDLTGWIAMIMKPQEQFVVLTQVGKQEQVIQRFLRIGYFNIIGFNSFDVQKWNLSELIKIQLKSFSELDKSKKYVHLDVRNTQELEDTGTFEESLLISLPELNKNVRQIEAYLALNADTTLVVNCRSGLRARFAASILLKKGIHPIVLNENIQNLIKNGFKMTPFQGKVEGGCCQIY